VSAATQGEVSSMHIPDGFLDAKVLGTTAVLSAAGVGAALGHARRHLPPRRIPLLGLTAAFVFAAQMVNFPIAGGTSGHLLGGVLAGALVGPSGAVLVLTAVLTVQCLVFADGGILALGANVLNMAVVGAGAASVLGLALRRVLRGSRGLVAGAAFAAWCGTVLAAVLAAAELAASGAAPFGAVFPAMATIHMLIGLGEAVITALVLLAVLRTRPDLLDDAEETARPRLGEAIALGFLIALALAVFVAPFASPWPDGLERVAETLGFATRAASRPLLPAPAAGYEIPGIGSATRATALAGAIGTAVVFALSLALARAVVPAAANRGRRPSRDEA
jgi:cobalt/nickel transport system permease protein